MGDRITDVPLAAIGDRGLFTKEIDRHVLGGDADLAVHSLKDMPTVLDAGLRIVAVLAREDPRDALVAAPGRPVSIDRLPRDASVGTSSLRRRAQLRARRADLHLHDLRGNLDTRLGRIEAGDFDAAIVALAGLRRLGAVNVGVGLLESPDWLPAAGQGALAIAARADDRRVAALCAPLDHAATRAATTAERALLRALEGGCQIPIGALATVHEREIRMNAFVAGLEGRPLLRAEASGPADEPDRLGVELAERLRAEGAEEILATIRATATAPQPSAP